MTKSDVLIEIHNLSAGILMGKATEDEIKKVTKDAVENNCCEELKNAFISVGETLTQTK